MADAISRKIEILRIVVAWHVIELEFLQCLDAVVARVMLFLVAISLHLYADSPDFEVRSQTVVGVYPILFGIDIQPFTECESLDMQLSSSDEFVHY